jgi:hypothetical protein
MGSLLVGYNIFGASTPKLNEFSVCGLMAKLKSQRQKIIRVRGELFAGSEITALGDQACGKPFTAGGIKWATAVDLVSSDYRPGGGEPRAPFVTEPAVMARLASTVAERKRLGRNGKVLITVTGFLRVRDKYIPMTTGYGVQGNGYGHLGVYPAQLVIKAIEDITILP